MKDLPPACAPTRSRLGLLALACAVAWALAAAAARLWGAWPVLGSASVALGAACLLVAGPWLRDALRPRPLPVLLGLVAGAAAVAATHLAYGPLAQLAPTIADGTTLLYAAFRIVPLPVAMLALAPVVVAEEIVWRGVVQGAAKNATGPALGVAAAAILYAAATLPFGSPVLALVAVTAGAAWGALRAATGGLVAPVVAHLVWNAVVLVGLPLAPA